MFEAFRFISFSYLFSLHLPACKAGGAFSSSGWDLMLCLADFQSSPLINEMETWRTWRSYKIMKPWARFNFWWLPFSFRTACTPIWSNMIFTYIYIYMYIDYNIHICIYLYHSIICHDLSRLFGKQLWLPQIWKNLRETSEYFQSPSECFKLYEVPAEHSDRACSTASWQSILQDSVDPPCWAQAPEAPQQNHHRQNPKRSWKQRRRHFFVPSKSSKILWNLNSWLAKAGPTKSSLECSVSRCPRHTSTFRTLMLCQGN